ncbi:MAG: hypothetical protein QNJ54_28390 [Prochloraceae cyanobacterium]|nr:hypothetical protein [Prochloraceae cyanobacterium]
MATNKTLVTTYKKAKSEADREIPAGAPLRGSLRDRETVGDRFWAREQGAGSGGRLSSRKSKVLRSWRSGTDPRSGARS